ncbi:transmembrane protein 11, mitochondrial-like [Dreissena polymorpha]|uniref:Transmembrane protein 11 n=1 Tax=Dreissena polymorpha TaxID=45954 RepID=A0A9D4M7Y6_DREPO|nr:transmembrane protein 11, mitochondrial-like [Dreissena polymorpha]XP_052266305.1 transmembrane protein 11, mitochondrial-like [Dreissena polymorpha]KAH3871474.1 hypothetical protein DPMN_034677 [Dreissena polymorpha]KAH3871490.1 hypothetical protein DPMN_034693 [Dreissena polymorpha]
MAVTTARTRPGRPPEYVIIRDVVDTDLTDEDSEEELERAFEEEAEIIAIEPIALGNEIARWIRVGNTLHKVSVLSGLASLILPLFTKSNSIPVTCSALSVICASVYGIAWQNDPCCKYQVSTDLAELEHLIQSLNSANPVVLVRRDDSRRRKLHNVFALMSALLCSFRIYKELSSS